MGSVDQTADSVLVSNSGGQWTSGHRLRGLAYIHAQLRYDDIAYASGTPNISAIVKGRKVYDPRTDTEGWSNNAALCVLDYLVSDFGLGANADEIDMGSFIAAANICDETVATLSGTEKRYTCNGVVDLSDSPRDILENMLGSCAGFLVHTGGKWRLQVGAYSPPLKTFDQSFLRDAVIMRPHRSRRQLFNTIKGAFVSPDHNWQSTDYPAVSTDYYIAQDSGEEIISTLDLSFTTSHTMAQRIARIALEQTRRQRQIQYVLLRLPITASLHHGPLNSKHPEHTQRISPSFLQFGRRHSPVFAKFLRLVKDQPPYVAVVQGSLPGSLSKPALHWHQSRWHEFLSGHRP